MLCAMKHTERRKRRTWSDEKPSRDATCNAALPLPAPAGTCLGLRISNSRFKAWGSWLSSALSALAVAAGAVAAARCNLSTRSELVVVDAESS